MQQQTTTPGTAGTRHDWMLDGSCVGRTDVDFFDLDCSAAAAARICDGCPVRQTCLDYAIDHAIEDGIWGGLLPAQIAKMRKAKGKRQGRHHPIGKVQGGRWHA